MSGMGKHSKEDDVNDAPARNRHWPLLIIAAPAAVAVWSGWVGLGSMCGFGMIHPLPGIWNGLQVNTDITLPIGVESYGAYALYAWLASSKASPATRTFACRSAIGALTLGCLGQVAFHLLAAAHMSRAPAIVVVLVACLPVVTLSFAAALAHLMHADAKTAEQTAREAAGKAAAKAARGAVRRAIPVPSGDPQTGPVEGPAAEPLERPSAEPRQRTARLSKDPDAEKARAAYRKSVRQGHALSDRALGEMFGRSRTWGAGRIREAEAGPKLAAGASS